MLLTTIVSVRAVTQMRKSGVKLQMHIAGIIITLLHHSFYRYFLIISTKELM
jgi:hypothetical protein